MALHKSFKFAGVAWLLIILGLAFIVGSVLGTANKSQAELQAETWRQAMLWLGILLFLMGSIGWHLVKLFFEYKVVSKALK